MTDSEFQNTVYDEVIRQVRDLQYEPSFKLKVVPLMCWPNISTPDPRGSIMLRVSYRGRAISVGISKLAHDCAIAPTEYLRFVIKKGLAQVGLVYEGPFVGTAREHLSRFSPDAEDFDKYTDEEIAKAMRFSAMFLHLGMLKEVQL